MWRVVGAQRFIPELQQWCCKPVPAHWSQLAVFDPGGDGSSQKATSARLTHPKKEDCRKQPEAEALFGSLQSRKALSEMWRSISWAQKSQLYSLHLCPLCSHIAYGYHHDSRKLAKKFSLIVLWHNAFFMRQNAKQAQMARSLCRRKCFRRLSLATLAAHDPINSWSWMKASLSDHSYRVSLAHLSGGQVR